MYAGRLRRYVKVVCKTNSCSWLWNPVAEAFTILASVADVVVIIPDMLHIVVDTLPLVQRLGPSIVESIDVPAVEWYQSGTS